MNNEKSIGTHEIINQIPALMLQATENLIQKQFQIVKLYVLKFIKVIFKYSKIHFRIHAIFKSPFLLHVTFILTFSHDPLLSHPFQENARRSTFI